MSNGVEQLSKKGAVLASLDRSGVETCAARVYVFGSDRSDMLVSREALESVRDGGSAVVRV